MRNYQERLERNAEKLQVPLEQYVDMRDQRLMALTQIFAILKDPDIRPSESFLASLDKEDIGYYHEVCAWTQTPRGPYDKGLPRFLLTKEGTQLPYNKTAEVLQKQLTAIQEHYPGYTTEIDTFRKCINRHTFKLPDPIVLERVKPRVLAR